MYEQEKVDVVVSNRTLAGGVTAVLLVSHKVIRSSTLVALADNIHAEFASLVTSPQSGRNKVVHSAAGTSVHSGEVASSGIWSAAGASGAAGRSAALTVTVTVGVLVIVPFLAVISVVPGAIAVNSPVWELIIPIAVALLVNETPAVMGSPY